MILYKYKDYNSDTIIQIDESLDIPTECCTSREEAYNFVEYILKRSITNVTGWRDNDFKGKRFLDIGMGNGNVLHYVKNLLKIDVYGVDISNYLDFDNYIEGKTFTSKDICDLPKELIGTFDVAYQRLFSVPFNDTSRVLLAASRALKPDGHYLVTFDDEYYEHEDSFVVKILNEIYSKVEVNKCYGKIKTCIASYPRHNPVLTPMESYYCVVTDEEYWQFESMDYDDMLKFMDLSDTERKEFLNMPCTERKKFK